MIWQNIKMFFKTLFKKRLAVAMFCIAGVLLIAAVITGYIIYHRGKIATDNAQMLLEEYKQSTSYAGNNVTTERPTSAPELQTTEDNALSPTQTPKFEAYEGYEVSGILYIEKLDLELPVISETSKEALEVSCCYYQSAIPGEDGNIVITGHNYADGSIFGNLDKLEAGDEIILTTQDGAYTYCIYETEVIKPDDTDALDEYEEDKALTLMTCTSHGNRRLLVKCCVSYD